MDFFENQEKARRKTGLLVFYYCLAVLFIVAGVYSVLILLLSMLNSQEGYEVYGFWHPELLAGAATVTLLIIAAGTLYKVHQLSRGGKSVAELLGGRPANPQSEDKKEHILLNVVEEMAIASGMQIPRVYILDNEKSINAFAAGFNTDDAVIGVTRGALEKFSRDELQGVIAHEFSHIINGDMRLNIKLMGVLHGILIISFIGFAVLRSTLFRSTRRRRSRSSREGTIAIVILGIALIIIGYVGVFFGNIIKSAISRQREYLADSAAVQYTRNPSGIKGALKKIARIAKGSEIENSHAQEASHLFFSNGISSAIMNLMSTHPPINERIKRIDPGFSGETKADLSHLQADSPVKGFAGGGSFAVDTEKVKSSVGKTNPENLAYAGKIMRGIKDPVVNAAHKLPHAKAVVYSLLLSNNLPVREKQLTLINSQSEKQVIETIKEIKHQITELPPEYRIPLLDISIATLKEMEPEDFPDFKNTILRLVDADGKISLFEYTVKTMLLRHLEYSFSKPSSPQVKYRSIKSLNEEVRIILSALAHHGVDDKKMRAEAFSKASSRLGLPASLTMIPLEKCTLEEFDKSLKKVEKSSPNLKRVIIYACAECVTADGVVTLKQYEMLRAAADAAGCPFPPLAPGKIDK